MKNKILVVFALALLGAAGYAMFQYNALDQQKNILIADIQRLNDNASKGEITYESIEAYFSLMEKGKVIIKNPSLILDNGNKLSFNGDMSVKRGEKKFQTDFSGIITIIKRGVEIGVMNVKDSHSFTIHSTLPFEELTANNFYLNYGKIALKFGSFEYDDKLSGMPVSLDGVMNLVLTDRSILFDLLGELKGGDSEIDPSKEFLFVANDKPYKLDITLDKPFKDLAGMVFTGAIDFSGAISAESAGLKTQIGDSQEFFETNGMEFAVDFSVKPDNFGLNFVMKLDDYVARNHKLESLLINMNQGDSAFGQKILDAMLGKPADLDIELSANGTGKMGTMGRKKLEDINIDLKKFHVSNADGVADMTFKLDHKEPKSDSDVSKTHIAQTLNTEFSDIDEEVLKHMGCFMIYAYNIEMEKVGQALPEEAVVKLCDKSEHLGQVIYNFAGLGFEYDMNFSGLDLNGRVNPDNMSFMINKGVFVHRPKDGELKFAASNIDSGADQNIYKIEIKDYKKYIGNIIQDWNTVIVFMKDYFVISEEYGIAVDDKDVKELLSYELSDLFQNDLIGFIEKISDEPNNLVDGNIAITVTHKGNIKDSSNSDITVGTLDDDAFEKLFDEVLKPHFDGMEN